MVMSVYMTISLTVERYLSVVHPLLSFRHRSIRSCLYLAAPGMIFSLLFTLPNYFTLYTKPVTVDYHFHHPDMEIFKKVFILEFKTLFLILFIFLVCCCLRMIPCWAAAAAAGSLRSISQ